MKFSIILPTWNGEETIEETLNCVSNLDTYEKFNFELILCDDKSNDRTISIAENFKNQKKIKNFKIIQNRDNLGYPGNIRRTANHSSGEYLFLLGQDDLIPKDILIHYFEILKDDKVGAICRPYYAFDESYRKPIRYKQLVTKDQNKPIKITINDEPEKVHKVFSTLDQLSSLCFKKKWIEKDFHDDVFPCHVYPFMSIFIKHPIVFTNKYSVAVRVNSSQCINVSGIYDKSPIESWVQMLKSFNYDHKLKKYLIKNFVCSNWIGLFQIKNYSKKPYRYLFREYFLLIKGNKKNIFNLYLNLTMILCIFVPRKLLVPIVNYVKDKINSKFIPKVEIINL
jgi:glycosyltransferase involved in cell wall biosynthesis